MPDCDYCDESFPTEDAYLDHLAAAHEGELGRIDQRRVNDHRGTSSSDGEESNAVVLAGFVVVLGIVIAGILAFVLLDDGGSSGQTHEAGQVHEHGDITVAVDGDVLDFDRAQYYDTDGIHFHPGEGNYWHMHFDRLAFGDAMEALGHPITDSSIEIDGETYDDGDPGTSVDIAIDGESVDPADDLQDGDHIQITVETPDGDGLDPSKTVGSSETTEADSTAP